MRRFGPIAAWLTLGMLGGLVQDAGATESGRRAARTDPPSAPSPQLPSDFLVGVPDSALRLPPNLRSAQFTAGPGKMTAGQAPAATLPRSGLRDIRRGSMASNARDRYDRFCDDVTAKIWDEPNGKRLKFDIRGKPGIAIAIPVR